MKQNNTDTEPLHMRFQKSLIVKIDRMRRDTGLTRTATVQWLVRRGLEAMRETQAHQPYFATQPAKPPYVTVPETRRK